MVGIGRALLLKVWNVDPAQAFSIDPDSSRGFIERNTVVPSLAAHGLDVTFGLWWLVILEIGSRGISPNVVAEPRAYEPTSRSSADEEAALPKRQQWQMLTCEQMPRAAALLVDTRTIGKAPTFTGEHKKWPEWSFQFTACIGSANPKSNEALRWAAMEENPITTASVKTQFQ